MIVLLVAGICIFLAILLMPLHIFTGFTIRGASDDMQESLADKLVILLDRGYFTKEISDKAHFVRKVGNKGAHGGNEPLTPDAVRKAIVYLRQILEYCARY